MCPILGAMDPLQYLLPIMLLVNMGLINLNQLTTTTHAI